MYHMHSISLGQAFGSTLRQVETVPEEYHKVVEQFGHPESNLKGFLEGKEGPYLFGTEQNGFVLKLWHRRKDGREYTNADVVYAVGRYKHLLPEDPRWFAFWIALVRDLDAHRSVYYLIAEWQEQVRDAVQAFIAKPIDH